MQLTEQGRALLIDAYDYLVAGGWAELAMRSALGKDVKRLRAWADETETGDRLELVPDVDDRVWRAHSVSSRECIGAQKCPYGEECFAEKAREKAREADVVQLRPVAEAVVGAHHVGQEDAVEQAVLQQLGELQPVVDVVEAVAVVVGMNPQPVNDVADAVHLEQVQVQVLRH